MDYPVSLVDQLTNFFAQNWFPIFGLIFGLYVGLPFLAPVFMHTGWTGLGKGIYFIYSFLCHQLPERSFFLFGPKLSYSLAEIQAAWVNTVDPVILRQFIGTEGLGWKVAWSDRMVSMFTSILLFGLAWWSVRRRVSKLPWWGFVLLLLPMAIDGTSHFASDLSGIGQGFRDSNAWLAALTNNTLSASVYAGDALGSFNSWMRLITGLLFGLGIVWFGFPFVDETFRAPTRRLIQAKADRELLERLLQNAREPNP